MKQDKSHRGHKRNFQDVTIAHFKVFFECNLYLESASTLLETIKPNHTLSWFCCSFTNIFLCLQVGASKDSNPGYRNSCSLPWNWTQFYSISDCFCVYYSPWLSPVFFSQAWNASTTQTFSYPMTLKNSLPEENGHLLLNLGFPNTQADSLWTILELGILKEG